MRSACSLVAKKLVMDFCLPSPPPTLPLSAPPCCVDTRTYTCSNGYRGCKGSYRCGTSEALCGQGTYYKRNCGWPGNCAYEDGGQHYQWGTLGICSQVALPEPQAVRTWSSLFTGSCGDCPCGDLQGNLLGTHLSRGIPGSLRRTALHTETATYPSLFVVEPLFA